MDRDLVKLIDKALKAKGMSAAAASHHATGHYSLIKNIKAGSSPTFSSLEKLFEVLGINLTYSLDDREPSPLPKDKVPMLGHIAAGGDDLPDDTSVTYLPDDSSTKDAPLPPDSFLRRQGDLFCLTVKGKSMLPVFDDGDRLYMYRDDPGRANLDRLIGHYCAVTLEHGEAYIKRLRRPDSGVLGEWNLESLNPAWPMMVNQHLSDCLPVRHVTYKV